MPGCPSWQGSWSTSARQHRPTLGCSAVAEVRKVTSSPSVQAPRLVPQKEGPAYRSRSNQQPTKPKHSRQRSKGPDKGQAAGSTDSEANRLAKVVAAAGIASRRAAERLIFQGAVTVNGKKVLLPQTAVNAATDQIEVNGKKLLEPGERFVFALNKPKGYLCTSKRPEEGEKAPSKLVVDLFEDWIARRWKPNHLSKHAVPPRLFTVGRLDAQTTGLLFVTNDGHWAQRVQHPSSGISKEYVVATSGQLTPRQIKAVAEGCEMDGVLVQPLSVEQVPGLRDRLRIVVGEGRNREVRRLVEHAGAVVRNLKRTRIGSYRLDHQLGIGKFRQLKPLQAEAVLKAPVQELGYV